MGGRRLTANQWFAITVALLVFVGVLGSVASAIALSRLSSARERLADRLDPAAVVSDALVTLLPGEQFSFTVRTDRPLSVEHLSSRPVLRCVNDVQQA